MQIQGANNTNPRNAPPPPDRVLAVLGGWIAGTAIHLQLDALPAQAVLGGLLLAACASLVPAWRLSRRRPRAGMASIAVLVAACAFSSCGLRAAAFLRDALTPALEGQELRVQGIVAAMPQSDAQGTRFRLDVLAATQAGAPVSLPPRIQLGWWAQEGAVPLLRAGERWELPVRLKAPHGAANPWGFDHELWLWEQGVQASGTVRPSAAVRLDAGRWRHPLERARQAVRDAVFAQVDERRAAGVIAALVTGDQAAIERADWDVFRATGVAHLMSISGLHVTMFAWLAARVAGALWRRSRRLCLAYPAPLAGPLCGLALAAAYAVFSGWGVPSQRTVWMLAAALLLRLAGRHWPWPHVWLLAAAVVLAADPWALLQAGFWLSFVAVGVLFAAQGAQQQGAPAGPAAPVDAAPAPRWRRVLSHARALAREQWIVTVALTPLTLLLFQQVSLVGLLANAVAIPWVTLVVTPLAMAGVLCAPLWLAAAGCVQALGWLLGALAAWPWATLSMAAPPAWAAFAGVAGGLLLAMRLPGPLRALGLPLLLPALLWQAPRPQPGDFELLAADVGQGNAVLVRTASHALLYDSGPRYGPNASDNDAGQRVLVPLLRALGERLDLLVLSHRDADHTGGARAVLAAHPQAALLASIEPEHELQALRPATRCVAGQRWLWDGVLFEILHPLPEDYAPGARPNTLSCVLRIRRADSTTAASALLAGDVERPQEAALLARGELRPVTVLLVPHHGSKTSSSDTFLDALAPRIALVQAGYRNRFGHPAAPVLARYRAHGVRLWSSPQCGAAHWSSARPHELRCEREQAPRYWHHRLPASPGIPD